MLADAIRVENAEMRSRLMTLNIGGHAITLNFTLYLTAEINHGFTPKKEFVHLLPLLWRFRYPQTPYNFYTYYRTTKICGGALIAVLLQL